MAQNREVYGMDGEPIPSKGRGVFIVDDIEEIETVKAKNKERTRRGEDSRVVHIVHK
jgi:hypothetical protein